MVSVITRDGCPTKPVLRSFGDIIWLTCSACTYKERLGYAVAEREYRFAADRHRGGGSR